MWIGEQPCMQMEFRQFSWNNTFVSIPGKLSEIHLHAWLFSNPCGKVLIIVGISWSPDLRVQHNYHSKKFKRKIYDTGSVKYIKNPAYGRQSISRPMRIVAPIPQQGGPRIPENPIFLKNGKNHPKRKNSKRPRDMPILAIYPSTRGL